jgi:prepilin-type processing-associated H-X9-DG protein
MYKVIGADNIEYGPVSAEKIREWVREGRANAQTRVRLDGAADWQVLSACKEFNSLFATPTGVPPPIPEVPATAGKTSALAITSLVLGGLGLITFGVTALVGLVIGLVALVRINNSRGALKGRGLAMAGTIVSGVFVLMLPIFVAMLLPALSRAKSRAQSISCMNNMKQLALGCMMYANENKDHLPQGDHWCDSLTRYITNLRTYQCPLGDPAQRCHYALNARLSTIALKEVTAPAQTVLMFETDGGWNMSGGPELITPQPRHGSSIGIVFADGHCEIARPSRLHAARWDP